MDIDVRRTDETGPAPVLRPFQSLAELPPPPTHLPPPLVPGAVAAVLAALAGIGGFAAGLLPSPASWIVAAVACTLAIIAGVTGFETPRFTVGRPLVKAGWIGPLTAAAGFLADYALTLPEGYTKAAVGVAVIVCAGLAGVPLPRPRGAR